MTSNQKLPLHKSNLPDAEKTDFHRYQEDLIKASEKRALTSREKQLIHLKPFGKHNKGNPKGRPKSLFSITDRVRAKLDQIDPKTKKTYAQLLAESMVEQALHSPEVLRQVLERVEGKVTENIDMRAVGVNILYELVKPREDKLSDITTKRIEEE